MESPDSQAASKEVPLPYVFFPKSDTGKNANVAPRSWGRDAGQPADAARPVPGKGDSEPASSKGERPPIMTPDERAWNDRLIKSFHARRSLIDAIVLSPSGVVISTLGRQVNVRATDMNPGRLISIVFLLLLLSNLFLFIWLVSSGFIYIRILRPFREIILFDWLKTVLTKEIIDINCSITTAVSLFVIKSRVTFYTGLNVSENLSALLVPRSNLSNKWTGLTESVIYLMTELLLGRQMLGAAPDEKLNNSLRFSIKPRTEVDATPVPHCFQRYNALRDVWNNLHYQCVLYLAVVLTQLYIAVTKVLFKRTPHFADLRDRELTPEQMRSRITIGLEGVAALQRICFFAKLTLVLQALISVMFQRLLLTIKHAEYSTRHLANRLQRAGLPATDVDICSHVIYVATVCGAAQCLAFFCFHSLAKFYSSIAASKVPQVRMVPSQDESYVT